MTVKKCKISLSFVTLTSSHIQVIELYNCTLFSFRYQSTNRIIKIYSFSCKV
uniref:Uncharacterized protein n=1 Tax=Medicago truncatula TaxID=3880 RepID=I3SND7_MEDTR|nr:unknown [Medicago truncatula]